MCQPNRRSGPLGILCILVCLTCPEVVAAQTSEQQREAKVMTDAGWLHQMLNNFWSQELKNVYRINFDPISRLEYYRTTVTRLAAVCTQSMPKKHFIVRHRGMNTSPSTGLVSELPCEVSRWATTFLILAHEWGHAVQTCLAHEQRERCMGPGVSQGLNADCLAGVFLGWAYRTVVIKETSMMQMPSGTAVLCRLILARPTNTRESRASVAAFQDGFSQGTRIAASDTDPKIRPNPLLDDPMPSQRWTL